MQGAVPLRPRRAFAGLVVPAPTMRALRPKPRVTFSPMRKSPKNLPEGAPLWVLPRGTLRSPCSTLCCYPLKRVCATNPDRFATLRQVGESVFFSPRGWQRSHLLVSGRGAAGCWTQITEVADRVRKRTPETKGKTLFYILYSINLFLIEIVVFRFRRADKWRS